MKCISILGIICVVVPALYAQFNTIEYLKSYASAYEENPPADVEDWVNPDYTSYHQSISQPFYLQILEYFNVSHNRLFFSPKKFIDSLDNIVNIRNGMRLNGETVAGLQFERNSKLYLWGDLNGSFHSLVRELALLNEKGVINNNLEVIEPDCYLIFNGNVIGASPYVLETLATIIELIKKNPTKVLYLRGKNEYKNYWRNFSLAGEVDGRISGIQKNKQRVFEKLSDFFNTLPLAFYIGTVKDQNTYFRISYFPQRTAIIKENMMGDFWKHIVSTKKLTYHSLDNPSPSSEPAEVLVVIESEEPKKANRTVAGEPKGVFGLGRLDQDFGWFAWAVLSSPNTIYQRYYDFHYDTFTQINITVPILDSNISVYNQDIRTMNGFEFRSAWNLISAVSRENIGSAKPFNIGSSLSLIGVTSAMATMIARGLSIRLIRTNMLGELGDVWIKLKIYNDGYIPSVARNNIKTLMSKDQTNVILSPMGSGTTSSYLDFIKNGSLLVLFPITGDILLRTNDLYGIINLRASYAQETEALMSYVMKEYATKKFVFFYQNDSYGKGVRDIAAAWLKRQGITDYVAVPYDVSTTDFTKQAEMIKNAQPDAIGFFSTAKPTQEVIEELGVDNLASKALFGLSTLADPSLRLFLRRMGLSMVFSAVVPNPAINTLPIVKQYREEMDVYEYQYSTLSLEAFIAASLFVEAMKKISTNPSVETLKKVLESFKDYEFQGLKLTFDPMSRSFIMPVWIETGETTDWIQYDNFNTSKMLISQDGLKSNKESKTVA